MVSDFKHLSIQTAEDEQAIVVKTFNVPVDFPFDISDNTFEIRYNEDMYDDTAAYDDVYPGHGGHGPSLPNFYSSSYTTLKNSTPGISRTSELFNTYYIYTFDGKLLAEYDHNGNCIRDYIYFGNRLIAEYKPQTNEYFYYMTDQINSTRIITNDNGDVVFSESYGPYGDIQKTWTNTYDPKLKFSGKEREGYSDLDYFGARYYDHKSYRFNSVDPIINKKEAISNPQLWNLYAYSRNNPITYFDPTGEHSLKYDGRHITAYDDSNKAVMKRRASSGVPGSTPKDTEKEYYGPIPEGEYSFYPSEFSKTNIFRDEEWGTYRVRLYKSPKIKSKRDNFFLHGGKRLGSAGCIDVGSSDVELYEMLKDHDRVTVGVKYKYNDLWPDYDKKTENYLYGER